MSVESLPLDVERIRQDFPILAQKIHDEQPLVYLDSAASTQRPQAVIDAIVRSYQLEYANVHRGIHWLSEVATERYEEARQAVQRFINAAIDTEVIFTSGTTAGINLVARAWGDANVGADDEIVLTELEHHSNIVPWQQLAERTGCTIRFAPIDDSGRLEMDAFASLLSEQTKLVAVTSCSNVLGTITPVAKIAELAHAAGALILVDAAQSVPHSTTDVQAWDADFVAFSGHKMLGPSGIGALYGKLPILQKMPPFMGGGSMINEVTTSGFEPGELPARFEAGTPPIVGAIGLTAAIEYLESIGLEAIHRHEQSLTEYAHQVLEDVGGVTLLGPGPADKGGIVSFVVDGVHAHDVAWVLDQHGVAVRAGHHCAMPLHERLNVPASNRASFYCYSTKEDVERLGQGIAEVKRKLIRS